MLPITQDDEST